jgi:hypothetical protein
MFLVTIIATLKQIKRIFILLAQVLLIQENHSMNLITFTTAHLLNNLHFFRLLFLIIFKTFFTRDSDLNTV